MENLENKDLETKVDELQKTAEEVKKENELLKQAKMELEQKYNEVTVQKKEIKEVSNLSEKDKLNAEFKDFLLNLKTGVTVTIPIQYDPKIIPTVGNWGVKGNCNNIGRLDSTVLEYQRSVSAGTAYWQSITGGGQSTSVSATDVKVNMDCITAKVPIWDYQINTKGYDVLGYVSSEINKAIPKEEDKQILAGTGTPFTGIYGDTDVNTVTLGVTGGITGGISSALTISALRAMVSSIDSGYRDPANLKWYVDNSEEQILLGVVDANNRTTDITTGVSRMLGYEVVPVSSGVLNGSDVSTTSSKHFILANLKEAVSVAEQGLKVEPIRTTHGQTDYYFYNYEAFGIRQPKAACILKLHA